MKHKTKFFARIISVVLTAILALTIPVSPAFAESENVVIDNCDSADNWLPYSGDGLVLNTTDKNEGTGCLALSQSGGFAATCKLSSAMDFTGVTSISFDFKSNHNDFFQNSGMHQLIISSRDDDNSWHEVGDLEWTEKSVTANIPQNALNDGWNTITVPVDFTAASTGFDITAVKKIMICGLQYYPGGDHSVINYEWIDNVKMSKEKSVPGGDVVDEQHITLYSKAITRAANVSSEGQNGYTDASWEAFTNAYHRASSIITKVSEQPKETVRELTQSLNSSINFLTKTDDPIEISSLYEHVVVLGVDGMGNYDEQTSTPNLDKLQSLDNTLYLHNSSSVFPSISAENWSSMLQGVTPTHHCNTNESISSVPTPDVQDYPSVFKFIRNKYPNAYLSSILNWTPIYYGVVEHNIGVHDESGDDSVLADKIINAVVNESSMFTFVQFDNVDHFGHASGYGSAEHLSQITTTDGYIGKIYDSLEANGLLDSTLFMVVTDHGGIGNGHGGNTPQEMMCSFYATGKNVKGGEWNDGTTFHTANVASITSAALGVPQSKEYDFVAPTGFFEGYTAPYVPTVTDKTIYRNRKTVSQPKLSSTKLSSYVDTSKLVGNFDFNDNLNNSVLSNSITMTSSSTNEFVDGYFGKGIKLSTDKNYLTLHNYDFSGSFTISMWVKNYSVLSGSDDPCIFANKDWMNGYNPGFVVSVNSQNSVKLNTGGSDPGAGIRCDTTWTQIENHAVDGTSGWVNVCIVIDTASGKQSIYLDFEKVQSLTIPAGAVIKTPTGANFNICNSGLANYPHLASFLADDFLLFDSALTKTEILGLRDYYLQSDTQIGMGDINDDGEIRSDDTLAIMQDVVNLNKIADDKRDRADVDGDGKVTSVDALSTLLYSVDKIDDFVK